MTNRVPINVAIQNTLSDLKDSRIVVNVDEVEDTITFDFKRLALHGMLLTCDEEGNPQILSIEDYQQLINAPMFLCPTVPTSVMHSYMMCVTKNTCVDFSWKSKRRRRG